MKSICQINGLLLSRPEKFNQVTPVSDNLKEIVRHKCCNKVRHHFYFISPARLDICFFLFFKNVFDLVQKCGRATGATGLLPIWALPLNKNNDNKKSKANRLCMTWRRIGWKGWNKRRRSSRRWRWQCSIVHVLATQWTASGNSCCWRPIKLLRQIRTWAARLLLQLAISYSSSTWLDNFQRHLPSLVLTTLFSAFNWQLSVMMDGRTHEIRSV